MIITVLLVALAIFISWNFYPKHYKETLNGVYYQLGKKDVSENIKIHIEGKLRNHLFGDKKFDGTVKFEGEMVPRISKNRGDLELWYEKGFGVINSFYRTDENGVLKPDIYHYGIVYINDDFTQFTIKVNSRDTDDDQGSWSEENGLMITAPADNREEAIEISDELIGRE
jgi:regulator of replication initiation timing